MGNLDEPFVEPLSEPPARSPDVPDLVPGYSHRASSVAEHCLTKLLTPCACCNSGSGSDKAALTKVEELNEFYPGCKNRSFAEPEPSGQVP